MAKHAKELEKMRESPHNWRYEDVRRQLRKHGFTQQSSKGSHRTWKHPDDRHLLTIKDPGNGYVKSWYIKEVVGRIDRVKAKETRYEETRD